MERFTEQRRIVCLTNKMFNIFKSKNNSADEKEIIELKKKIAYMETDISILKTQYDRLLTRTKVEEMSQARTKKKEDDMDIQKIIAQIAANPKQSLQEIIANNPDIVKKIMLKL